jgi:PAS domain S-box-containing protein
VLPDIDGFELCRRVKDDAALREVPVVLMTAFYSPEDLPRALECGADNFLRKPYAGEYLLTRIEYILASRAARKDERTQMGVEIEVAGRRYFITAARQQILDLLAATYEDAIGLNEALSARQAEVERSRNFLYGLYRLAEALNQATSVQAVADAVLERAVELPGVQAGWISLREGDEDFRVVATRGLPSGVVAAGLMQGDCLCRRKLRSGELRQATNILKCERLERHLPHAWSIRYHASIPLWDGERTLGVMNLAGPDAGLFREEDLVILSGVGNQVAVALARARLLEQLNAEVSRQTLALRAEVAEREHGQATQQRLVAILEATSDLVGIVYPDGGIVYCNQAGRRMLGIGPDEDLAGRRIADTHPEWASRVVVQEAFPAAIRDGTWSGETALLSRDGREIPVSQVIIAHRASDGAVEYLSTIARDISERKRAEEARRQTEKLVAMGELLSGVAHELNNPLSVVVGRANLLRARAGEGPLGEQADKIVRAADRCARIVKNFLALAREYPLERQAVELNRVIGEALELLAYQLRVDGVEVERHLTPDLPIFSADPHQLHQVVVNLVTNAHHAVRETAPPRRIAVTTGVIPGRSRVFLELSDSGPGIPPDIHPRVFEPFFTTKPPGQGTGLGLSLCKGIVEGHGGTITIASPAGRGATVRVELPVEPLPERSSAAEAPSAPGLGRTLSILAVDDEPGVLEVLAEVLAADGHRVDTAPNGVVALERLRDRQYDVVITDLRMPELDGPALYREIERVFPALRGRVILLTGDTLSPQINAFLASTRAPSLKKPFNVADVRRVLQEISTTPSPWEGASTAP